MFYRISGHESFPCRYTWLPKVVRGLRRNPRLFADEDQAMVELGLGKNMVHSARFWAQSCGITHSNRVGYTLTQFGNNLLSDNGFDPFLEDIRTLWLIHWQISTVKENPLLAWDFLLNMYHEPELVPSHILKSLEKEATKKNDVFSQVTLDQHLKTFIHTYFPTQGRKVDVQEDNLDCPLVELELIQKVGEREIEHDGGKSKHETIYLFRRDEKPDITPALFAYCLNDFWQKRHHTEDTIPLSEVAHGYGSPGRVFKLSEDDIRMRVESLASETKGFFRYFESMQLQQVRRQGEKDNISLIKDIYAEEAYYA